MSNHTYTVVPGNVDTGGGNDTQAVVIKLAQSEFPDAYVQFKTSDSNVTSLRHIVVDNGSTRLIRLYNAGSISNGAVYDVRGELHDASVVSDGQGGYEINSDVVDVSIDKDWEERFPGNENTILVRIFGNTYTIYCSSQTVYDGNVE